MVELWLPFCMAVDNGGCPWEKVWSGGATASILHGTGGWGLMVCHFVRPKNNVPNTQTLKLKTSLAAGVFGVFEGTIGISTSRAFDWCMGLWGTDQN